MHDRYLFLTYNKNIELTFVSYYSNLDDVFLHHRFKVPYEILNRLGYAANSSSDGTGCLLFDLDKTDELMLRTFNVDIVRLLKTGLRELKLNYLGI
jgi:hypothetical protein